MAALSHGHLAWALQMLGAKKVKAIRKTETARQDRFLTVLLTFRVTEVAEKVGGLGEIPENRPSAAKAALILLDLCTG